MWVAALVFKRKHRSRSKKNTLFANVKYRIKHSDNEWYYTINRMKIPKTQEHKSYEVVTYRV